MYNPWRRLKVEIILLLFTVIFLWLGTNDRDFISVTFNEKLKQWQPHPFLLQDTHTYIPRHARTQLRSTKNQCSSSKVPQLTGTCSSDFYGQLGCYSNSLEERTVLGWECLRRLHWEGTDSKDLCDVPKVTVYQIVWRNCLLLLSSLWLAFFCRPNLCQIRWRRK